MSSFLCQGCSKLLQLDQFQLKKDGTNYKRCKSCREKHAKAERGKYVKKKPNAYDNHPELREEWNEEKNGSMSDYSMNSRKKVWWMCCNNICKTTGYPHEWDCSIRNRVHTGCPFCSNHRMCPCGCNSLYTSNPELREDWNEEKNGSMKLYSPSSTKKVWWICAKDICKTTGQPHEWEAVIGSRTRLKVGCSVCANLSMCPCGCNSLYTSNPELREEWNEEKNGSMKLYSPSSNKKVWWTCSNGICDTTGQPHEWEATVQHRSNQNQRRGCPFCTRQKQCSCGCNSLYASNPELRDEWNEEKNGSVKLYSPSSGKKVWWICAKGMCKTTGRAHQWVDSISHRSSMLPRGCPFCSNRKMCPCGCNSLYASNPELQEEWNEEKNGSMKLYAPSSGKKVWWRCSKFPAHEWITNINHRSSKEPRNCPKCCQSRMERKISEICRHKEVEEITQDWHNIENSVLYFDHYLPIYNAYIECQGQQHFDPDSFYAGEEFTGIVNRDLKKIKFVRERSHSFLSISYLTPLCSFEQILSDFIEECNKGRPVYRFYYDDQHYWDVGQSAEPVFENNCNELVRNVYQKQYELFN